MSGDSAEKGQESGEQVDANSRPEPEALLDHEKAEEESVYLDNLQFGYPGVWKLGPLNMTMRHGEFWGMVGPNGAGKSTLMKTILGLVSPLAGKVSLGGFADRPGGIAYLPQKDTLSKGFPVSAVQVVLMGLAPRKGLGRPFNSQDRHKAMESLQSVGLERAAHQPFGQLSGGEQQRVLLARALIGEPGMLMLDEPTTGMDVDAGRQILHLVTELTEKRRQTVLMISHMLDDIRSHTHKVIYVHRLNGTIRIGTPDEILGDPCVNEPTFEGES